jgi:pimeloyl-ACP methyl ester carboxylesterase
MNTNDLLAEWSTLSLEEIEARLADEHDREAATELFGADEVAEMQALANMSPTRGLRQAVVLLPGVMGSLLTSIRGVTTLLWINPLLFVQGRSRFLELNQAGDADAVPEIETVPLSLEKMVYTKMALALRSQCDLFEFPYDWRRPIEWNGDRLHEALERWSRDMPDRQFTLVGHSMGGIVSRAYLARHGNSAARRVKRLIMLGTPHFGAAGAVENLLLGNRMMEIAAKLNRKNSPSRLLLNMPSVYELLPPPPDLFPGDRPYPANWDLYDADAWDLEGLRQDYLDLSRAFHEWLAASTSPVPMVEIAGCNEDTVVDVARSVGPDGEPTYRLSRRGEGTDAGDGTVPLWSAILPGATIYYIEEVHRDLPKNRDVIDATLDLIYDRPVRLPTRIPTRRAVVTDWPAPLPAEAEAERLRQRIEAGTANEEDLAQLYFAF